MNRFLRLFDTYVRLESRVETAELRAELLTHENVRLTQRVDVLSQQVSDAQKSEIAATRQVADAFARRYGGPVYGIAGELPAVTNFEPIPKQRPQGSDLVAQAERDFFAEMEKMAGKAA